MRIGYTWCERELVRRIAQTRGIQKWQTHSMCNSIPHATVLALRATDTTVAKLASRYATRPAPAKILQSISQSLFSQPEMRIDSTVTGEPLYVQPSHRVLKGKARTSLCHA